MKISKSGYKKNSKDKNEPALVIPSNNITMKDVDFPVYGVDDTGYSQMMYPGMDYMFPGNYVYELPMAQDGGTSPGPYISNLPEQINKPIPNLQPDKEVISDKLRISKRITEIQNKIAKGTNPLEFAELSREAGKLYQEFKSKYPNDNRTLAVLDYNTRTIAQESIEAPYKLPKLIKITDDLNDIKKYASDIDSVQTVQDEQLKWLNDQLEKKQSGGDISIPDLSNKGWLSKYQTGGVHQKIYTDPLEFAKANRAYNDSLSLYNNSERKLKEFRIFGDANNLMYVNPNPSSSYLPFEHPSIAPIDRTGFVYNFDRTNPNGEVRMVRRDGSLDKNLYQEASTLQRKLSGSPSSIIPIYKKPTEKPKLDQQAVMQQISKDYPGYSIKFEKDKIFIREPETEYMIDNGIHNIWQPLPTKKPKVKLIQSKAFTGFDRPEQELKSSTTKIGSTKTKPIMRSAQDTKTGQYQIGYNYWDDKSKSWKQKMFSKETQQENYDDVKIPRKKTIKVPPQFQNGGWLDRYQTGGSTVSDVWQEKTGLPWSEAKKRGYTSGSYDENIKLLKSLKQGNIDVSKAVAPANPPVAKFNQNTNDINELVKSKKTFNEAFTIARNSLGPNQIFEWNGRKYGTNLKGETFNPSSEVLEKVGLNNTAVKNNLNKQNRMIRSIYSDKTTVKLEPEYQNWEKIKKRQDEYNKMDQAELIKQYHKGSNDQYLILDKSKGKIHFYQGDQAIASYDVGIGQNVGDEQTKTVIENNKVIWDKGNKMTGAGIYTVSGSNASNPSYSNAPTWNFTNERGVQVPMAMHSSFGNRTAKIKDSDPANNRLSNGCINGLCYDLKELYKKGYNQGDKLYVLPDDTNNKFEISNGKLVFKSKDSNVNKTIKTLNYIPIKVTLDENAFKDKVFTPFDFNDEDEFNTTKNFVKSLETNKQAVMKAAKINGDIYNELAKMAFGIYGTESNYGDTHSAVGNFSRAVNKAFFPESSSSPDYESKATTYDADEDYRSVGLTQLRWSYLNDDEKKALKELGINNNMDFLDPAKAAAGTVAILGIRYNQQLTSDQKNNMWEHLPSKWNKRANYPSRVKENSKYVNIYQPNGEIYTKKNSVKPPYKNATSTKISQPFTFMQPSWVESPLPKKKHGGSTKWLHKYQDAGPVQRDPNVLMYPSVSGESDTFDAAYSLPTVNVTPKWTEAELERNRLRDDYIEKDKNAFRHWYDKLGYDRRNVDKRATQYAYNKLAKEYLKGDRDKLTDEQKKFIGKSEYAARLQPTVGERFVEGITNPGFNWETLGNIAAPLEYPTNLVRGAVKGEFTDAVKGYTPSPYFVSSDLAGTSPTEAAIMSGIIDAGVDSGLGAIGELNLIDDAARASKYTFSTPKQLQGSPSADTNNSIIANFANDISNVNDVNNLYRLDGEKAVETIRKRKLESWKTEEGRRRLQKLIDNTPGLENETPDTFIKRMEIAENKATTRRNADTKIAEIENQINSYFTDLDDLDKLLDEGKMSVSNYTTAKLDIENKIAVLGDLHNDQLARRSFLGYDAAYETYPTSEVANIYLDDYAYSLIDLPYAAAHEVSGHSLNILPGKSIPTYLDEELSKLKLIDNAPETEATNLPKQGISKFYHKYGEGSKNYLKKAIDYFLYGSKSTEKVPFLTEVKEDMLLKGIIKNDYDKITPQMIKEHYNSYKKTPGEKFSLRLYDIIQDNEDNFKQISNVLNDLPSWAAPTAIGTGTAAVIAGQDTPQKKHGGWLHKYQDGGDYNMQRALELGYTPDETGHWDSVDSETGMWLKSKKHPTSWMEYLYGYTLNPELNKTTNVVINPEGYFGENQLQYVSKYKKGGVKSSGEGYYDYINGYSGIFAKGGNVSKENNWLNKYK